MVKKQQQKQNTPKLISLLWKENKMKLTLFLLLFSWLKKKCKKATYQAVWTRVWLRSHSKTCKYITMIWGQGRKHNLAHRWFFHSRVQWISHIKCWLVLIPITLQLQVNAEHAQDFMFTITLLSSKNVLTEVAVNNSVFFLEFIRKGRIYTIIVHNGHSTFSRTPSITVN